MQLPDPERFEDEEEPSTTPGPPEPAAAKLGLVMFEADDWTLQIDDDRVGSSETGKRWLPGEVLSILWSGSVVDSSFPVLSTRSRSGRRHWYLALRRPFSIAERVALQAALGSDPKREALNLVSPGRRVVLFETEAEAGRVKAWLHDRGRRLCER